MVALRRLLLWPRRESGAERLRPPGREGGDAGEESTVRSTTPLLLRARRVWGGMLFASDSEPRLVRMSSMSIAEPKPSESDAGEDCAEGGMMLLLLSRRLVGEFEGRWMARSSQWGV